MSTNNTPRIYVACLAAYNSGYLHGEWVAATQDVELIEKEIQEILDSSPVPDAEEWAIHDYDNFYEAGDYLGEYPNLENVVQTARFIEEYGNIASKLINHCGNIDEAIRIFEEDYSGCYKSLAEFAEEVSRERYEVPEWLEGFIDWESMGEDWELGGDIFTIETEYGEVNIFWNT